MKEIIYKINHAISQKLATKPTTVEDWYKSELKKSRKELTANMWLKENFYEH